MEAIYIGVDFHARQQTIRYLKTEIRELVVSELKHQDKEAVRAFYQQFQEPVIVGLEARGYSPWFEAMVEELGHEVWLGHPTEIAAALVGATRMIGVMRNSFEDI
jgi:hypothetical protein